MQYTVLILNAFVLIPDLGWLVVDGVCFKALGASDWWGYSSLQLSRAQIMLKQIPVKIFFFFWSNLLNPGLIWITLLSVKLLSPLAYYKDPAEQLLSDPQLCWLAFLPFIRPGFLHTSGKVWKNSNKIISILLQGLGQWEKSVYWT